jgi:hypothetical protein
VTDAIIKRRKAQRKQDFFSIKPALRHPRSASFVYEPIAFFHFHYIVSPVLGRRAKVSNHQHRACLKALFRGLMRLRTDVQFDF